MADKITRITPAGNMDKDSDPRYVGKGERAGDYLDARNIQAVSEDGNLQGSAIPTKGCVLGFDLGSVTQQNKRYRIYLDGDATKNHSVRFLSTTRSRNITVGTGPLGEVEFNGTVASCVAAIQASNNAGIFVLGSTSEFVNIELTTYPMYQWYVESIGPDPVRVVCTQEAITVDLAGPLKDIGSYDLLGDLFVFSTTQDNEPTEIQPTIILAGPTSGGTYIGPVTQLLFNGNHGLVQGQAIRITDCDEPFLNGLFVVHSVVSPTQIEIVTDTAWGAAPPVNPNGIGTPKVLANPTGIGEIGVAQKNDDTDSWTYTRLLRSVELNFVSLHDIESDGRTKNGRKILYFTDDYNGVLYISHKGSYITDGLLNLVNPENFIFYGSVTEQTSISQRIFSETVFLDLLSQSDSGGQLMAGNKYYTYRFLDQLNNPTPWADIVGAIPVYSKGLSGQDPISIKGDEPGFVTSKSNNLQITGIPQGIFREVEVAVIEAADLGSIDATMFTRIPIPPFSSSVTFSHTGFEKDQVTVDVGEIVVSFSPTPSIEKAKCLQIIDKRLVLGNLQYRSSSDFSEFAKTFQHSLSYKATDGTGNIVGPNQSSKLFAGPISPNAVKSDPTLVLLETYRIGVDFELFDGSITETFYVDDIKIDTSQVNTANPTDNRRISGLPDYILNEPTAPYNIRVPQIVFSGINPDYLIGGIPARRIIAAVRFRFAKIEREVLASGYVVMGVSGGMQTSPVGPATIGITQNGNQGNGNQGAYPFPNFLDQWAINGTNVNAMRSQLTTTGVSQYPMSFTPERRVAAFFSPDVSMGDFNQYEPLSADKLVVFYPLAPVSKGLIEDNFTAPRISVNGQPITNGGSGTRGYGSSRAQYIIHPEATPSGNEQQNAVDYRSINIEDAQMVEPGLEAVVGGVDFKNYVVESTIGTLSIPFNQTGTSRYKLANARCIAIKTVSDIFPADANPLSGANNYWSNEVADKGIYYAQLFREKPNKYGEQSLTEYNSGSVKFDFNDVQGVNSQLPVSGGDAFITTTYIRHRFNDNNASGTLAAGSYGGVTSVHETGRHIGIFYAAQSYRNMDLVYPDPAGVLPSFPETYTGNFVNRLYRWTEDLQGEYIQFYNPAYSRWFSSLLFQAYFDDDRVTGDLPARIAYSVNDVYSSIDDAMMMFPPFNIHDLDTTWGEINSLSNVNGELFSIQDRKWQKQYFNSRGTLESSNNSVNVLLGAGDVMSRDGETLSFYGTFHQRSVIKGRSQGGKDVLYWFNAENGLFLRFGADGTVIISDTRRFRSFSNKAAKWVRGKDTPAFEQGIRSVWDDRSKEAIWTFTGWRDVPQWARPGIITPSTIAGAVVSNPNAPSVTYESLPRFFRAKSTHANLLSREPGVGADWQEFYEEIPVTDTDYYSVFTVAHNEMTSGFKTFYGHIPKTYLKWRDTFLSSHPIFRNLIFEHRRGEYCTWYGDEAKGIAPKIEDAHVEMVVNELPEQSMRGVAVSFLSENAPDRVDFSTPRQRTFSESQDFVRRDDQYFAPIRGDVSQGLAPNQSRVALSGDYLRVKFTIFGGTYNLLHSIIVKIRDRMRRINN
jgi:hypothetical protein